LARHFDGRIRSITPPHARGCQLSLVVEDRRLDARSLFRRLESRNVIADWREPNVIRVAPAPLYVGFEDVHDFVERLRAAVREESGEACRPCNGTSPSSARVCAARCSPPCPPAAAFA